MIGRTLPLVFCVLLVAAPAAAQGTAVSALSEDSVFIEAGAGPIDEEALRDAVSVAAGHGIDLRVAVLADDGAAPDLARSIASGLEGAVTVLVFTSSSYGVFSDELSQSRLDDALSAAADELSGPDVGAGAAAFAAALDPDGGGGGVSAGLVIGGTIALLLVVGLGGRVWEVRTRAARQARRRDRRRHELTERTRRLADRVLQLSDPVELAGDRSVSSKYAEAAATFDRAEVAITEATTMHQLDEVDADLADADRLLDEVQAGLDSG